MFFRAVKWWPIASPPGVQCGATPNLSHACPMRVTRLIPRAGALVPDDVIIGIVKDRLKSSDCKQKGWLLDGFPRTGVQAEAMAKAGIVADKCIFLDVPDEKLIERCEGRRTDPKTGAIYHLKFNPPPNDTEVKKRLVHR
jgi:adenylate kinase